MINHIAIMNGDGVVDRLEKMGYVIWPKSILYNQNKWIFIIIYEDGDKEEFGHLITYLVGDFAQSKDIVMGIKDVPLRKNLDEWVKVLNEGSKMGLL